VIGDLEARLAEVLGEQLPVPFRGKARVAPGDGSKPLVIVGVERVVPLAPQFGDRQQREVVPGSVAPRRVVRAHVTVRVSVQPTEAGGRGEQVQALDAALYVLDAPDVRNGSALATDGDPGFLVSELRVTEALGARDPATAGPPTLVIEAEGMFWPPGVAGETGVAIRELPLRGIVLPLRLDPQPLALTPGGAPVDLAIAVPPSSGATLPSGSVVAALRGLGGRPGAGVLAGGTDGASGARLLTVSAGSARVRYTPPAAPAIDQLIISLDDGDRGAGIELGRFRLVVRA
jgi:hypothetical protein